MDKIQQQLFKLQDLAYRDFHAKLMPTVDKQNVIGIRTPALRKFAKEFAKTKECDWFIENLPHKYYEENNLHGMLIASIKDYNLCIERLDKFLPYVDNWATCDLISPKVFAKNLPNLLDKIKEWINSDKTYTIRFGIKMLMTFYLDEAFLEEYLELVAGVKSNEYYVNMMIAWFFATALAKRYNEAITYIEGYRLDKWVHNKTIQKAKESFRIDAVKKEYLETLKQ